MVTQPLGNSQPCGRQKAPRAAKQAPRQCPEPCNAESQRKWLLSHRSLWRGAQVGRAESELWHPSLAMRKNSWPATETQLKPADGGTQGRFWLKSNSLGKSGSSSWRICLFSAVLSGRPSATVARAALGSHLSRFRSTVKGCCFLDGSSWSPRICSDWFGDEALIGQGWSHASPLEFVGCNQFRPPTQPKPCEPRTQKEVLAGRLWVEKNGN